MNSPSLLELVAASSEATCSAGEPSAQLNVMPTPHPFWRNDKTMDASRLSRFGLTCAVLTADRGEELLTWFRAGFRARTSRAPGTETESAAHARDFGSRWRGSLAKWSHGQWRSRTPQTSLLEDSESSWETWPTSGLMRHGIVYQRHSTVPRISANGLGLLPTPTVSQGRNKTSGRTDPNHHHNGVTLMDWIWLNVGRERLKASFVEWMMLWPSGWTDLKPLETAKFREWQQQHSLNSQQNWSDAA